MELKLGNRTCYCATTLRVVYSIQKEKNFKTFQETLNSLNQLDTDEQINLIYTAYKCDKNNTEFLDKETFINELLDNCGVYKLTEISTTIVEGLLFSGLSTEEIESKKVEIQKIQAGMISSNVQAG